MTCRKPKMIVADHDVFLVPTDNLIPDDIVFDMKGFWRFGDGKEARLKPIQIPLKRTACRAFPLSWFSNIIDFDASCPNPSIHIQLDPGNEEVRQKYPFVNPLWHMIQTHRNAQTLFIWITMLPGQCSEATYIPTGHSGESIDSLLSPTVKTESMVHHHIALFGADDAIRLLKAQVKRASPNKPYKNMCIWNGSADSNPKIDSLVVTSCDWNTIKHEIREDGKRLGVAIRESRPDRVFDFYRPEIKDAGELFKLAKDSVFVIYAPLRQPYHHDQIVTVCLALLPILPPYVVLAIVEFLPKMNLWSHVKKIRLIEAVDMSLTWQWSCQRRSARSYATWKSE